MRLCREVGLDCAIFYRPYSQFWSTFVLRASEASKVLLIYQGDGCGDGKIRFAFWNDYCGCSMEPGLEGSWVDGGRLAGWLGQTDWW